MAFFLPCTRGILGAGSDDVKNFHLPLPPHTYAELRAASERTQIPATVLAREAIDSWLRQQARKARHDAIAAYAAAAAGTAQDRDPAFESAAVQHLIETGKRRK
jgi:hypothetical protein